MDLRPASIMNAFGMCSDAGLRVHRGRASLITRTFKAPAALPNDCKPIALWTGAAVPAGGVTIAYGLSIAGLCSRFDSFMSCGSLAVKPQRPSLDLEALDQNPKPSPE